MFAAASMTDAINEVGDAFDSETGIRVAFSFGASQSLARQVAQGAPADVFLSAGRFPMDFLAERNLIAVGPRAILSNTLVVVTKQGSREIESLSDLASGDIRLVALADPGLSPAGRYARDALESSGVWDRIEEKLVWGGNVRAALAYVETGNADAALVYRTDAYLVNGADGAGGADGADGVTVADVVPPGSYGPILYPASALTTAPRPEEALMFLDFLSGETAQAVFRKHGFLTIE